MGTFIEFQAMVLEKLCGIESRLSNIEASLGISCEETAETPAIDAEIICDDKNDENHTFKNEINDFQNKLADIKSLLSSSEY